MTSYLPTISWEPQSILLTFLFQISFILWTLWKESRQGYSAIVLHHQALWWGISIQMRSCSNNSSLTCEVVWYWWIQQDLTRASKEENLLMIGWELFYLSCHYQFTAFMNDVQNVRPTCCFLSLWLLMLNFLSDGLIWPMSLSCIIANAFQYVRQRANASPFKGTSVGPIESEHIRVLILTLFSSEACSVCLWSQLSRSVQYKISDDATVPPWPRRHNSVSTASPVWREPASPTSPVRPLQDDHLECPDQLHRCLVWELQQLRLQVHAEDSEISQVHHGYFSPLQMYSCKGNFDGAVPSNESWGTCKRLL